MLFSQAKGGSQVLSSLRNILAGITNDNKEILSLLHSVTQHQRDHIMSQEWVKLNIGGTVYQTTRTTLLKDENSMIHKMFSQGDSMSPGRLDENGCYLIDR